MQVVSTPNQSNQTLFSDPRISHYKNPFWSLQIGGWVVYAFILFFAILHPQLGDPSFNLSGQLWNLAVETLSGLILSSIQWLIVRRLVHLQLRWALLLSFTSATILGSLFNLIKLASYKTIVFQQVWYEQLNVLEFGGWLLFSLATMFVFNAVFFIMLYNSRLQREHEMLLRAQNSAKEAQLQMLRYQLNPHFMFNTLNAISTLILKNENDDAGEMLDRLCSFFRYSLDQKTNLSSTLRQELALSNLYLNIEKVRFKERLQLIYELDETSMQAVVPSFLLQPLLENAIKYGIESRSDAGTITIRAQVNTQQLSIIVEDDGSPRTEQASGGFGIGLNNTQERMNTLFNTPCSIELEQRQPTGTRVKLTMPYQTTPEEIE